MGPFSQLSSSLTFAVRSLDLATLPFKLRCNRKSPSTEDWFTANTQIQAPCASNQGWHKIHMGSAPWRPKATQNIERNDSPGTFGQTSQFLTHVSCTHRVLTRRERRQNTFSIPTKNRSTSLYCPLTSKYTLHFSLIQWLQKFNRPCLALKDITAAQPLAASPHKPAKYTKNKTWLSKMMHLHTQDCRAIMGSAERFVCVGGGRGPNA